MLDPSTTYTTFYFEEPVNKYLQIPLGEYLARKQAEKDAARTTALSGLGYRQVQKFVIEHLFASMGFMDQPTPSGKQVPITVSGVPIIQEDIRFLSAQDYTPLNKLRQMQQVGVVLCIFSENFKKHLK